ncbi:MAG: DoxX family protein [candidate division NC10 bacterium]|nr:DoxX family protein [candidate division NC10 bacterium]MBI2116685.1 DoxX family protein [candidate division NC10 bacterium]MBI2455570.1 DoxX family protein [candidate division NC10 bacterium]MBI3084774.1 DoxX family protein [candidate division NC10 bacterium]MBI3120684.1 DoxX family protein [candidate division NC10 bacterium]
MARPGDQLRERLPGIALFLARLYVGYWFLATGFGKVGRGFLQGGMLLPQLERFAAGTPHAWYKAWLVNIVIPNEYLFAVLTSVGEALAGAAILLGALTRFAAGVGIFMVGNYLFAKGWPNPAASHDKDFLVLLLVILVGGAGRYWGIDGWWRRRR